MREFQFAPGDDRKHVDSRRGKLAAMWTINDVRNAMHAHADRFSVERTLTILKEITGLDPCNSVMQRVESKHYALLITRYTEEVAERPHQIIDA